MTHIMYGLPGSGKTHLAKQLYTKECDASKKNYNDDQVTYFCLDEKDYETFSNRPNYGMHANGAINIIDGFFPTINILCEKLYKLHCKNFRLSLHDITIHNFIPNIEACIINDRGRRKEDAIASIMKGMETFSIEAFRASMKKLDPGIVPTYAKIAIVYHKVQVYNKDINKDADLISPWLELDDNLDFELLDRYLEEYYPNTSFLQYKKLSKLICKKETSEYDYYDEHGKPFIQYSIKLSDIVSVLGQPI